MLGKICRRLEEAGMLLACACIVAIMVVICYDAAVRYLFRAPLQWAFEIVTNYLLICSVYFALASTFFHSDHISIDLLHARLPVGVKKWADVFCNACAMVLFSLIAFTTFEHAMDALQKREFYPGYRPWPVWLSYLPIALGSATMVIRLVVSSGALFQKGDLPPTIHDERTHAE
jgi:TRAP-type C4-dicarboxylate transport system permease small subunit